MLAFLLLILSACLMHNSYPQQPLGVLAKWAIFAFLP